MATARNSLGFEIDPGEGVFYGPKIDIKIKDQLGRSWQCSTIQVDFNLPERFDITYTGSDNSEHRPIMIHRALMGSLERFIGVLIEKDLRNEKLNYKIREAQMAKIPYMLIIGEKEKADGTVTVRLRDGKNLPPMPIDEFAAKIDEESRQGRGI